MWLFNKNRYTTKVIAGVVALGALFTGGLYQLEKRNQAPEPQTKVSETTTVIQDLPELEAVTANELLEPISQPSDIEPITAAELLNPLEEIALEEDNGMCYIESDTCQDIEGFGLAPMPETTDNYKPAAGDGYALNSESDVDLKLTSVTYNVKSGNTAWGIGQTLGVKAKDLPSFIKDVASTQTGDEKFVSRVQKDTMAFIDGKLVKGDNLDGIPMDDLKIGDKITINEDIIKKYNVLADDFGYVN